MIEYIESEISYLLTVYGAHQYRIVPHLEIDAIVLDVDTAMHCGMIINELVSNVFKHAFPPAWAASQPAEVRVAFQRVAEGYALTVQDNGVGLPPDLDPTTTPTLGLNLVAMLVEQLEGTLDIIRKGGTTFHLTFPPAGERGSR